MSLTKVSYSLITGAPFNVFDYGATGDGTTDDANAIQAALNAANLVGGGMVFLPAGTYLIATSLTIYSNTRLSGSGWSSIIKVSPLIDTFAGRAIKVQGADVGATYNIILDNFQIDGNKNNVAIGGGGIGDEGSQSAIDFDQVYRASLINLYVHDAVTNGLYANNSCRSISVIGGEWYNNGAIGITSGGRGLVFGVSPIFSRIVGAHIYGNLFQGIIMQSEGGSNATRWTITGNVIEDNGSWGIDCTDNIIAQSTAVNIFIADGTISGNSIIANGGGIRISENTDVNPLGAIGIATNITITGNTIRSNYGGGGSNGTGVLIQAVNDGRVDRVTISGNNICSNVGYGININGTNVRDTFVDGNTIISNTLGETNDSGSRTVFGINKTSDTNNYIFPNSFDFATVTPTNAVTNDMFARMLVRFRGSDGATQGRVNAAVTRTATGTYTITVGTDFSNTSYQIVATALNATPVICTITALTAGSIELLTTDVSAAAVDPTSVFVVAFGAQS